MKIKNIVFTPELAKEMLKANSCNRPVKKTRVALYAREMQAGNWKPNTAETIKIAKDGTVLDGQHRLLAIIKSGVSIELCLATELDNAIFDVIDTGAKRSNVDAFAIQKAPNPGLLAATINKYNRLKSGKIGIDYLDSKTKTNTNSSVLAQYKENPKKWDGVVENVKVWVKKFNRVCTGGTIGGFYSLFYDIDPDQAFSFCEELFTDTVVTNPTITVLKNALIRQKVSGSTIDPSREAVFFIKTWNCYRKGTTLQLMKADLTFESNLKPI